MSSRKSQIPLTHRCRLALLGLEETVLRDFGDTAQRHKKDQHFNIQ